ncbi:MAG: FAD:protein FMN transferase [Reyranella sp.]|uniref:FAD:protein FMN transferase n=1 Tax=Reyranella sp. TaxID=1929291 RepID=UPI001AD1B976|nr:FAD:protein FMN transferase [Reyranella sp.]MBN9086349.1 FAD:protein FMN transferase [Reyranella sp.]
MTSCCVEACRARPLLGTLVEITAWGADRAALDDAIDRSFDAVATVHRLMSFQEPDSELSRHNRGAAAGGLHPWTQRVLAAATDLRARSGGAFDAACGGAGIDLSGIAKGFAVDRAIETLRSAGVARGIVNAGGDLAVFGDREIPVGVRDPAEPGRLAAIVRLGNTAFASSARPLDPMTRKPASACSGASVRAPSCMIADALTKVVGVSGEAAVPLLREMGAVAVLFRDGRMVALAD